MIKSFRTILERRKGQRLQIEKSLASTQKERKNKRREFFLHEKAREVIKTVGIKTQQQLQFHISDITSLALESVFDNAYELKAEFVQRRNKTECDLMFVRDGNKIDPLEASGYGAVDIASLALRIASWSMNRPKSRATILLDEPMKFLSRDKQDFASQMLKELSEKLGIQFIIVTHEETLTQYADKIFQVKIRKGISSVKS